MESRHDGSRRTRIPSKSSPADESSEQSLCASIDAFGARLGGPAGPASRQGDARRGIAKFIAGSVAMRHTSELCMKLSESMSEFAEKNDDAASAAELAAKHAEALFEHLDTALSGPPGRPKGPAKGTVPACAARSRSRGSSRGSGRSRGSGQVPPPPAATATAGAGPLPLPRAGPAGAGHLSQWELRMAGPAPSSAGPAPSAAATPAARARPPVLQEVEGCSDTELEEVLRPPRRPPL